MLDRPGPFTSSARSGPFIVHATVCVGTADTALIPEYAHNAAYRSTVPLGTVPNSHGLLNFNALMRFSAVSTAMRYGPVVISVSVYVVPSSLTVHLWSTVAASSL